MKMLSYKNLDMNDGFVVKGKTDDEILMKMKDKIMANSEEKM